MMKSNPFPILLAAFALAALACNLTLAAEGPTPFADSEPAGEGVEESGQVTDQTGGESSDGGSGEGPQLEESVGDEPQRPTPELPEGPPIPPQGNGTVVISEIHMFDLNNGLAIAVGSDGHDRILSTSDGAVSWTDIGPPQPILDGNAMKATIAALDSRTAFVGYTTGPGTGQTLFTLWRTTDGGATWADQTLQASATLGSLTLTALDANTAWTLASFDEGGMQKEYVALYSTDVVDPGEAGDGTSWSQLWDPTSDGNVQSCPKRALVFGDADNGWIGRDCHGLYVTVFLDRTLDGGATYESIDLPIPSTVDEWDDLGVCRLLSLTSDSPDHADLSLGCRESGDPEVLTYLRYVTIDGADTWGIQEAPGGPLLFVAASDGFSLGRDLYRTSDGGGSWEMFKSVNWDGQFSWVDSQTGWAVARNEGEIALVSTVDGGETWQEIDPVNAGP